MPKKERDYKEEYKYHKKPLSKGGSNSKKNVVAQTRKKNRTDYNNED